MDLLRIALRIAGLSVPGHGWKYFHLSPWDLGKTTTLRPRVPDWTKESWAGEDCTTPRVCLAPTIEGAVEAIHHDPNYAVIEDMYVYATKETEFLQPNQSCPDSENNPFGWDWDWKSYAEANGLDPKDRDAYAKAVEECIPDPQTGEVWALKPITLTKIGKARSKGGQIKVMWNFPRDED